jgi:hypothetical protein
MTVAEAVALKAPANAPEANPTNNPRRETWPMS